MKDATKFYIAAPFFNPQQLRTVEAIKTALQKYGFNYYSPKDELLCKPDSSKEERQLAFNSNLEAIDKASYVVAVTDDKDMGTLFECGYAHSRAVPIIYVALTLGNKPFNLMLAESGCAVCKTMAELVILLSNIKYKNFIGEGYDGQIE